MNLSITRILLICTFCVNVLYAQTNVTKQTSYVPPSPDAASLGKYGDIPVSFYKGTPNIRIPLFDLQNNGVSISLGYLGGGIKVTDQSSWVGLGWSLDFGGLITRVKKHRDDLSQYGYHKIAIHNNNDNYDKEPDVFYINSPAISGKFIIDYDGNTGTGYKILMLSSSDDDFAKIELITNNNFRVTDKFGTIYEFLEKEIQNDRMTSNGRYRRDDDVYNNVDYVSTWYLSKVSAPNGKIIQYYYRNGPVVTPQIVISQTKKTGVITSNVPASCWSGSPFVDESTQTEYNVKINTRILDSIVFDQGKIIFSTTSRVDIKTESGIPQKLSKIELLRKEKTDYFKVKEFEFQYEYFDSNSGRAEFIAKRLKLVGLTEKGYSAESGQKNYGFEYQSGILPDKDSFNVDHWGFYCGNRGNSSFFPIGNPRISRNPDETSLKIGSLVKIIYPTKGYTTFIWEANDFSNHVSPWWTSSKTGTQNLIGSGLRIKTIKNVDDVSQREQVTNYDYLAADGKSSGVLMVPIRYDHPYEINTQFFSSLPSCSPYNGALVRESGTIYYAGNILSMTDGGTEMNLGYSDVQITKINGTEILKSSYQFHNNELLPTTNRPTFPYNNNNLNGKLIKSIDYRQTNSGFAIAREKTYSYLETQPRVVLGYLVTLSATGNYSVAAPYAVHSSWVKTNSETLVEKAKSGNEFSQSKSFNYDESTRQITEESYQDAANRSVRNISKYTTHYTTSPYLQMANAGNVATVIEKEQLINNISASRYITDYGSFSVGSNTHYRPIQDSQNQYGSTFIINQSFGDYDEYDNPQTVTKRNSANTAYKWGYYKTQPIAEFKNAKAHQVQHLNFEESTEGFEGTLQANSSKSHTGKFSGYIYNPSSNELTAHGPRLQVALNHPKRITYSGWIYSDGPSTQIFLFMMRAGETGYYSYVDNVDCYEINKWVYISKEVVVPGDVYEVYLRLDNNGNGGTWFDDLAIRPSESQFTTFTYEPFSGLTSTIDTKGITTYYEYDSLQRLRFVKDQDGNIIKSYCYNYAGQNMDCNAITALPVIVPPIISQPTDPGNPPNPPTSNCSKYRIFISSDAVDNLYITYQPCESSGSVTVALSQLPQMLDIDGVSVDFCIYGSFENFQFRYGQDGPAQLVNGITVTSLGACN